MLAGSPEDERGVDLVDVRRRLRLRPAERVERMVEEVRVLSEIRGSARASSE